MSSNKTTETNNDAERPAAPNGHGTKNGAAAQKPNAAASVKKRKKKHPPIEASNTPAADSSPPETPTVDAAQTAAPAPDALTPIATDAEPTQAAAEPVAEPLAAPAPEPATAPTTAPTAAPAEPIADGAPDGLRLRMKVWTDTATSKRYLMPTAFMRDVVNGQPVSDVMYAYAMSDDDTRLVLLRASEWNALPFYYFQEVGSSPRASTRPVDVVVVVSSGSEPP